MTEYRRLEDAIVAKYGPLPTEPQQSVPHEAVQAEVPPTPEQEAREEELWAQMRAQAFKLGEQLAPIEAHKKGECDSLMARMRMLTGPITVGRVTLDEAQHEVAVLGRFLGDQQIYDDQKRAATQEIIVLPLRAAAADDGITKAQQAEFRDAMRAVKESLRDEMPLALKQELARVPGLVAAKRFPEASQLLNDLYGRVRHEAGDGKVASTKLGKVLASLTA